MEIALIVGYLSFFIFLILKLNWFRDQTIRPLVFVVLFVIKVAAGIFAGELYDSRYKGGDTHTFFESSKVITNAFRINTSDAIDMITGFADDEQFIKEYGKINGWNNQDVVYNDSRTMIRLNAFMGLLSMGFYNIHVIFFAFMSLFGLSALFKAFRLLTSINPWWILLAVFLIPGEIFWLSVASKESLLIFVLGIFFYNFIKLLFDEFHFRNITGFFLTGFLFVHIKAYMLVLITPAMLSFIWVNITGGKNAIWKYLAIYVLGMCVFFNIDILIPNFNPIEILFMKRTNFEAFADAFPQEMGSYIALPEFTPDWWSLLKTFPYALFAILTRPYLWESSTILVGCAAVENILLLGLLIYGLIRWKKTSVIQNNNLLLFSIFFVITVYILIGMTSPVMGAIVRYKAPVLPFFCLIPIMMSESKPKTLN